MEDDQRLSILWFFHCHLVGLLTKSFDVNKVKGKIWFLIENKTSVFSSFIRFFKHLDTKWVGVFCFGKLRNSSWNKGMCKNTHIKWKWSYQINLKSMRYFYHRIQFSNEIIQIFCELGKLETHRMRYKIFFSPIRSCMDMCFL